MKTYYKILIAKIILKILSMFAFNLKTNCKRNSLNWCLDLNEGIDLSIFIFGRFEYEIIKTIKDLKLDSKKNINIIDIGSNVGAQTLQIAMHLKNSTIYSIEPTDFAFKKLLLNINSNPIIKKSIYANQVLLTDNRKSIPKKIYSSWNLTSKKSSHKKHGGYKKNIKNAKIMSFDQFIKRKKIQNVKMIKLDVDGAELKIFKSGKNFFKKNKPYIIMELAPYLYPELGYNYIDLLNEIKSIGYKFYSIYPVKKISNINNFTNNINNGSSKNILLRI
jgi:FkbM family methyltransferase